MRVFVVHKSELQSIPPVISVIILLKRLKYDVSVLNEGINWAWKQKLDTMGVDYFEICRPCLWGSFINKLMSYVKFNIAVRKILKPRFCANKDLLWVEGAYTVVSLRNILGQYKFVLQISELHEQSKVQIWFLSKYINKAEKVFMPEYNRTFIYQAWFKLKQRPIVLPNKPYFLPAIDELKKLVPQYKSYVDLFKTKKIILYQGWINKSTRDMTPFVRTVSLLDDSYRLVMLGHADQESLESYKQICPHLIHIDFIPAPDYLLFTALSYIGVVAYNPDRLNHIFCAPNKIFEYSSYGKPIIGNCLPGLEIVTNYNCGYLVDFNNVEKMKSAIVEISSNYDMYCSNSKKMYESIDNFETIKNSLQINETS